MDNNVTREAPTPTSNGTGTTPVVLVAYVPDETGLMAVKEAGRQAAWRDARLVVLNVVTQEGYLSPTAAEEVDLEAVSERLALAGTDHEVRHLETGSRTIAEVILDQCAELSPELVVVGLKRRSRVGKILLGSTAQRLVLEAPCPVLTMRAPGA